MKGFQATTRLCGNVYLNAVQDAITPTIRSLMIKGTIAITGWAVATVKLIMNCHTVLNINGGKYGNK